jgi:hypothetical protein
MLELGEFEAKLQVMPLLDNEIVIDRIVLKDTTIVLETDAQGTGNWVFDVPQSGYTGSDSGGSTQSEGSDGFRLAQLGTIDVVNANLIYRDGVAGTEQRLTVANLSLAANGGSATWDLDAVFQDMDITLDATTAPLEAIAEGASTPVNATLAIADAKVALTGEMGQPLKGMGANLSLDVDIPDLAGIIDTAFAGNAPFLVPDLGPLTLSGSVQQTAATSVSVSDLAFSYGGADVAGSLSVDGSALTGSADLKASIADPAALAAASPVPLPVALPDLGALTFEVQATSPQERIIDLAGLALNWGDLAVDAKGKVTLTDSIPLFDGTFNLSSEDIARIAAPFGVELPAFGPLAVAADADVADEKNIDLRALTVTWGDLAIAAATKLELTDGLPNANGSLDVKIPDVAKVAAVAGVELPADLGALDLKSNVSGENGVFAASDLALALGEIDVAGSVSADMTGARPSI